MVRRLGLSVMIVMSKSIEFYSKSNFRRALAWVSLLTLTLLDCMGFCDLFVICLQ
jgi:hypothetical protein